MVSEQLGERSRWEATECARWFPCLEGMVIGANNLHAPEFLNASAADLWNRVVVEGCSIAAVLAEFGLVDGEAIAAANEADAFFADLARRNLVRPRERLADADADADAEVDADEVDAGAAEPNR